MNGYVYLLRSGPFYKIGITRDVTRRLSQLGTQPPFEIEIYHIFEANDPSWTERFLHWTFHEQRKNGEWFTLSTAQADWICGIVGEYDHRFTISDTYVYAAYELGAEAVRKRIPKEKNPFVTGTIGWRSWNEAHHDMAIAGGENYLWRDPYPEEFDRMRAIDREGASDG